jgi:sortase (surface protein transpeptidase)
VSSGGGGGTAAAPRPVSPIAASAAVPSPQTRAEAALAPAQPRAPTPGPAPAPVPPPLRLIIPSLGVDAAVEDVGVDPAGAMATPHDIWNVGWFSPGPAPGAPGDAVVDGHLGLPGYPLVFNALGRLRVGDLVRVTGADGRNRDFTVSSISAWPAASHPTGLFDTSGPARLSLITCDGAYYPGSRTYADRLVVEADFTGLETL